MSVLKTCLFNFIGGFNSCFTCGRIKIDADGVDCIGYILANASIFLKYKLISGRNIFPFSVITGEVSNVFSHIGKSYRVTKDLTPVNAFPLTRIKNVEVSIIHTIRFLPSEFYFYIFGRNIIRGYVNIMFRAKPSGYRFVVRGCHRKAVFLQSEGLTVNLGLFVFQFVIVGIV